MAVYDLEEQEKLADLKAWWQRWGNLVSTLVIAACVAYIGWQGWRWWQNRQADEAAVLYSAVAAGARGNDAAKARDAMAQLASGFAGTGYAPRAALLYARMLWDAGDKAGAKAQFNWVIERAKEDELKQIARFRLAEALVDEKQYDQALATLDARHADAFAGVYADLRGDALVAAGRKGEAKSAYETALAKLDAKSPYRNYVQVKLEALGGAAPAATGSATAPAGAATPATAAPSGGSK
jgi:predicted negative regulator of RcsB-dependent stress response